MSPTPEQRTVFDSHRVAAALELKQPQRVIAALQLSERDFPTDYNPPARLAAAFQALQDWDRALAARVGAEPTPPFFQYMRTKLVRVPAAPCWMGLVLSHQLPNRLVACTWMTCG